MSLDKDMYARLLKAVRGSNGLVHTVLSEQSLQRALRGAYGEALAAWGDDERAKVRAPLTSYGKLKLTPETADMYMVGRTAGTLFSVREQQYDEMHKWLLIVLDRE